MGEVIRMRDVSFSYAGQENLFTSLNFSLPKGTLAILVGSNGSGKTTFLNLCSGLLKPSSGTIEIEGVETKYQKRIFDLVTLSFQYPHHQFVYSTVNEELRSWVDRENENTSLSKMYNLESFHNRSPFTLSEGEKKQLALSCALSQKKSIIFLDEPTLGLDHNAKQQLLEHIKKIREDYNPTIVISTHDLSFLDLDGVEIYELVDSKIKKRMFEDLMNDEEDYAIPQRYLMDHHLDRVLQTVPKEQAQLIRCKFDSLVNELEGEK